MIAAKDDAKAIVGLGEKFPLDELDGASPSRLQEPGARRRQAHVQDETDGVKLRPREKVGYQFLFSGKKAS